MKIIIADDHKIFLDGVVSLLSEIENFDIVAGVTSGEQLIEYTRTYNPDIIITDISMKGITGIEATKKIKEEFPDAKVLVLSMHKNEEFVISAVESGANGYLPKDAPSVELIEAINTIYEKGYYYNREISELFLINYSKQQKNEESHIIKDELTSREMELLKLVASGLTNKEISEKLFISIKTVEAHKNHILQKLKLKNSIELVLYAVKNKLVEI
ncbi:MAG: hypothetical protein A2X64_08685 [Ignavibacteria bacterium GWF2_33_9]|nr:MAG: hypothetical protein A2X64_08685 [Ignavibacteria bacterium GWF2_33_9]